MTLQGQTALITGATGGFGSRIARVLAKHGANVIVTGRNQVKLTKLVLDLGDAGAIESAADVIGYEHNLLNDPELLFERIDAGGHRVTILINNAGIGHADKAEACPEATFRDVLDVDLIAPFLLAQAAARRILAHRQAGCIVNVASIFGQTPGKSMVAYAVAKAGLLQLTRALALEWGPLGIRVNALAPGWSLTPMTESYLRSVRGATIAADIPLGRFGHPADLDGAILLLCSDMGRYINGATIVVDGGLSVGMREGQKQNKPAAPLVTPDELGVGVSLDY